MMRKTVLFILLLLLAGCQTSSTWVNVDIDDINKDEEVLLVQEWVDLSTYDSIHYIANKKHALPNDYEPEDLVYLDVRYISSKKQLRKAAADALKQMFEAAEKDGYYLSVGSAYRSYTSQVRIYKNCVVTGGQEEADRSCAKAGYSEHQTGLAVDLTTSDVQCYLKQCFGELDEGKWLYENAHRFGFVLRYPKGKEEITGYKYEPWHFRYLGITEATKVYKSGLTLEEYYQYE